MSTRAALASLIALACLFIACFGSNKSDTVYTTTSTSAGPSGSGGSPALGGGGAGAAAPVGAGGIGGTGSGGGFGESDGAGTAGGNGGGGGVNSGGAGGAGGTGGTGTGGAGGAAPDEGVIDPLEALTMGGVGSAVANGVAVDGVGDIVVVGTFTGTANFGTTMLTAVDEEDVFVAKYQPDGTEIFAKRFGDEEADDSFFYYQAARDVAIDSQGNIIVCGLFYARLGFGGPVLDARGDMYSDAFLVKLDKDGSHVWTKRYGDGDNDADDAMACAVNADDDVIVAGRFATSIHPDNDGVDDQAALLEAFGGAGDFDMFVASYDQAGNYLASKTFAAEAATTPVVNGMDVASNGRIALTGTIDGDYDFGGGTLMPPAKRGFIAVLDENLAEEHAALFTSAQQNVGDGVAFGPLGDLYVLGSFKEEIDLGSGALAGSNAGDDDLFVAKLDDGYAEIYLSGFGNMSPQQGRGIAVGEDDRPVITGRNAGSIDFGSVTVTSAGGYDGFVAKINLVGDGYWALGFGDAMYQYGTAVAVVPGGAGTNPGGAVLVGNFSGDLDVGTGEIATAATQDCFLATYAP